MLGIHERWLHEERSCISSIAFHSRHSFVLTTLRTINIITSRVFNCKIAISGRNIIVYYCRRAYALLCDANCHDRNLSWDWIAKAAGLPLIICWFYSFAEVIFWPQRGIICRRPPRRWTGKHHIISSIISVCFSIISTKPPSSIIVIIYQTEGDHYDGTIDSTACGSFTSSWYYGLWLLTVCARIILTLEKNQKIPYSEQGVTWLLSLSSLLAADS